MNGPGKSDTLVVPKKPPNKEDAMTPRKSRQTPNGHEGGNAGHSQGRAYGQEESGARTTEEVEGSSVPKGNQVERAQRRTQSRETLDSTLGQVRAGVKRDRQFNVHPRSDCASSPEGRAQCGNPARWDLCGGHPETGVPTATPASTAVVRAGARALVVRPAVAVGGPVMASRSADSTSAFENIGPRRRRSPGL